MTIRDIGIRGTLYFRKTEFGENAHYGNWYLGELNFEKTGFGKMAVQGICCGILTCNWVFMFVLKHLIFLFCFLKRKI